MSNHPVNYPQAYVYDSHIDPATYVDDTHPFRVGIAFDTVPSQPLQPTLIPVRADGKKVNFYPTIVGRRVGILLDQ